MFTRPLFTATTLLFLFLSASAPAVYAADSDSEKPLLEKFEKGYINWKTGEYFATVTAPIPTTYRGKPVNEAMGKELALRVTRSLADSVFLQIVANTRVDAKQRLSELVKSDAKLKLSGNIRGKKLIKHNPFNNYEGEWIKASYRISMRGVNGVISNVFNQVIKAAPAGKTTKKPSGTQNAVVYIDARHTGLQPALFPEILDENNKPLFDPAAAGKDYITEKGVVEYTVIDNNQPLSKVIQNRNAIILSLHRPTLLDVLINQASAEEVKPPVRKRKKRKAIKATEATGLLKANIIVSKADADKMRLAQNNGELGLRPQIIVVTDGTIGGTEGHLKAPYSTPDSVWAWLQIKQNTPRTVRLF